MKPVHLGADRREDWNGLVAAEPRFSLLQSWEWGEFKEALGWTARRIAVEDDGRLVAGAQLLIKRVRPLAASIGYVPRGPVGDWRAPGIASVLFEELAGTMRRNRGVFLRVEPGLPDERRGDHPLGSFGFRPGRSSIQPRATIILDLRPGPDDIQKSFRRKTRQYIHQAAQSGITVRAGGADDIPIVYGLLRETSRRAGFPARVPAYYESEWRCLAAAGLIVVLMAYHGGRLLAVRTISRFGRHAAEFHAGSVAPVPHLYPNHLLVWEAIQWARSRGCESYDLWGIPEELGRGTDGDAEPPDAGRTDGLWGVYRFKRGFGQNVVLYTGAQDLVLRPRLYALMGGRWMNPDLFERLRSAFDRWRHP